MTVKASPGSSLEVIETEFFFHLLVSLLANPTRLDGGCYGDPLLISGAILAAISR
jgi:hypothetical protein